MALFYKIYLIFYFIFHLINEICKNIFGLKRRFEIKSRIDGKVVVITGANTGIGKATASQLCKQGAKVIIGCRDLKKAETAVNDIKANDLNADIIALKLDLSSLSSVRQFSKTVAKQETKIDILINNAGVMACPESQTEDGFETVFGTNHLGHFLLTLSLMPLLKKSSDARVVTVSSMGYLMGEINFSNINLRNGWYNHTRAYSQSKLANVLFTRELARRLGQNSNVKTYCLHPGLIKSDLGRHVPMQRLNNMVAKVFCISTELGAQTSLYCALEPSIGKESGFYYDNCQRIDCMGSVATDDNCAEKLWELSTDLVKLEDNLRLN